MDNQPKHHAVRAKPKTANRAIAMVVGMALAIAAITPHPAHAGDPAKVEKLLVALRIDRQLTQMKGLLLNSFASGFADAARRKGLTPAEIERSKSIVLAAMSKVLDDSFSMDYLRPQFVRIYSEGLSDSDIDAALAYYSSPAGQSLLDKMPALMQRGAEIGMRRAKEMQPAMEAAMNDAIRKIRAESHNDAAAKVDDAVKQVHDAAVNDAQTPTPVPAVNAAPADDATPANTHR